jgi:hypothetical protein
MYSSNLNYKNGKSVILCYGAAKGKRAMKALQWLRGKDTDISQELQEIENAHNESEKSATGSTFELFNKSNVRPLLISLGLMFFKQMSGINAVVFYTVMIFKIRNFVLNFSKCIEFHKKILILPRHVTCYLRNSGHNFIL